MFRKFRAFEAPSSLEFRDPDTGHIYRAANFKELYTLIVTYRHQNNLEPIELLRETVENYLCSLPENTNKCCERELGRSIYKTIRGGVALLKNLAFGKYASEKVAEARAAQCVKCPHNVFPDRGPFHEWADNVAIMQVGERRTSLHNELGSCAVCECPLRSKVFFAGKVSLSDEEVEKMKAVNCWQLKLR